MRIDYYTLLCPEPISLSIGTIRQPTLREIGKLTFPRFGMYQVYLKLTPSDYYEIINKDNAEKYWDVLSDEEKKEITLYDVVVFEESLRDAFLEVFNFFFVERVIFKDNFFLILKTDDYDTPQEEIEISKDNLKGVINPISFVEVVDIIQQVCCIKSDDPLDEPMPKFKNKKAKKLYERMLKAKDEQKTKQMKKDFINLTLPNIISATAAKVSGLNILNIWDATLFQVYDQFEKIQNDDAHYINSVRVAVWGDEKKQFDPALWYKNNYEKQPIQDI